MKFTVSSTAMANKLAAMAKVMNNKPALPILSTFMLEVKEDAPLEVTASDLECVWHGSLDITGQEGTGKVCITASTLLEAVRNLPEQPITFTINDNDKSVTIHYLNGHYDMAGFGSDEYPMMQDESDIRFDMDAATLCNSIDQSLYAVSYDAQRPVMTGISYTFAGEKVECAASDGHKLVRNTYPLAGNAEDCRFILSAKAAKIVKLLLQKKEGNVEVAYNERNIVFKTDTDSFSTRLIEGYIPTIMPLFPPTATRKRPSTAKLCYLPSVVWAYSRKGRAASLYCLFRAWHCSSRGMTLTMPLRPRKPYFALAKGMKSVSLFTPRTSKWFWRIWTQPKYASA